MRKSAAISTQFLTKLIEEIERVIDEEIVTSQSELSTKIDGFMKNKNFITELEQRLKLDPDSFDLCYAPIVQSGGNYNLDPTASSPATNLSYDTIIMSLGAEYYGYKTNVVRTLLIDPTQVGSSLGSSYNFSGLAGKLRDPPEAPEAGHRRAAPGSQDQGCPQGLSRLSREGEA